MTRYFVTFAYVLCGFACSSYSAHQIDVQVQERRLEAPRMPNLAYGLPETTLEILYSLFESDSVMVSGEQVVRPGIFPYTPNMTVSDAIQLAGGLSDCADRRRIKIYRLIEGIGKAFRADLETPLKSGDLLSKGGCPFF